MTSPSLPGMIYVRVTNHCRRNLALHYQLPNLVIDIYWIQKVLRDLPIVIAVFDRGNYEVHLYSGCNLRTFFYNN